MCIQDKTLLLVLASLVAAFYVFGLRLSHRKNSSGNPPLVEIPVCAVLGPSKGEFDVSNSLGSADFLQLAPCL